MLLILRTLFSNFSMKPAFSPPDVLDGYLRLTASLTTASKLDLVTLLSASLKAELAQTSRSDAFNSAFGAFKSSQTAEELIAELRVSRTSTRQIEPF